MSIIVYVPTLYLQYFSATGEPATRKDELFNILLDDLKTRGVKFNRSTAEVEGSYITQVLDLAFHNLVFEFLV